MPSMSGRGRSAVYVYVLSGVEGKGSVCAGGCWGAKLMRCAGAVDGEDRRVLSRLNRLCRVAVMSTRHPILT